MGKRDKAVDKQLVAQYQSGDGLALQKLVKRWHKTFCERAYWLTKDAEASKDIAQESWSAIITKISTLKDSGSFQSWALRIVFTKAMDWMRANQRNRNKLENYYNSQDDNDEEKNDDEALKKALLSAVKSLPTEQQIVIRLFYVESYSLKEMSTLLEVSVGTVKSRLFHAREKIKEQLKNKNYEN